MPLTNDEINAAIAQAEERKRAHAAQQSSEAALNVSSPNDVIPSAPPPSGVVHAPPPMATPSAPPDLQGTAPDPMVAKRERSGENIGKLGGLYKKQGSALLHAAPAILGGVGSGVSAAFSKEGAPPAAVPPQANDGDGGGGGDAGGDPTQQQPLFVPSDAASKGGGGTLIPGGWFGNTRGEQHKLGHDAPAGAKLAFEASSLSGLQGAKTQRDADMLLAHQTREAAAAKMAAVDAAAANHQQVQVERQAEVARRLQEIEQLNAEASTQIDPEKYWHDRGAAAKVIGAIAMGLGAFGSQQTGGRNMAAEQINAAVNREIDAQLANQGNAHKQVGLSNSLLKLHLDAWGDQDKAIDATKLALFDNALGQMEQYKADHMATVSEATYQNAVAGVLEHRGNVMTTLQAHADGETTQEYQDKWHMPQVAGGPGKKEKKPEDWHVLNVPSSDKTGGQEVFVAVDENSHKLLSPMVGATFAIRSLNTEALNARRKLREATEPGNKRPAGEALMWRQELATLQLKRIKAEQKADGEGVTRDADFKQEMDMGIDYTAGIGGRDMMKTDERIQRGSNRLQGLMDQKIRGAGGHIVTPTYDENRKPGYQHTGQIYRGSPVGSTPKTVP